MIHIVYVIISVFITAVAFYIFGYRSGRRDYRMTMDGTLEPITDAPGKGWTIDNQGTIRRTKERGT